MTGKDYLAWEAEQEGRYEFIDGQVRLMAGGTRAHGLIAQNITLALRTKLGRGPCFPMQEQKVATPRGNYRYPDVTVDCGRTQAMRDLAADEPRVVFEVESPSNTTIDEVERLEDFQSTPTVQQTVIVSQTKMRARICTRAGAGWRAETLSGEEAALDLSALECALPFTEIYERVEFEPPAANA
ncbi:Uma2 family endonuclease [Vitreimonas sp.]|uniref:Uma2 family endonuclease n=1 Tax=Vitreimonas sp. TaxID=3069702 RepID=UPI002D7682E6|nr:Uma2 family endonuclease [Vitreimonas sp.]